MYQMNHASLSPPLSPVSLIKTFLAGSVGSLHPGEHFSPYILESQNL